MDAMTIMVLPLGVCGRSASRLPATTNLNRGQHRDRPEGDPGVITMNVIASTRHPLQGSQHGPNMVPT